MKSLSISILFLIPFVLISCADRHTPENWAQMSAEAKKLNLPSQFVLDKPLELDQTYTLPAGTYKATQKFGKCFDYWHTEKKESWFGILKNGKDDWGCVRWCSKDDYPTRFKYRVGEFGISSSKSEALKQIRR